MSTDSLALTWMLYKETKLTLMSEKEKISIASTSSIDSIFSSKVMKDCRISSWTVGGGQWEST